MTTIPPTPRTTHQRRPHRGSHDRAAIYAILDEALVCHVGFVADGQPFVIPTIHTRVDDRLYFHGSVASRMLGTLGAGVPVCVTVTLVDGLVLARSAMHHSMNYRSAVILGTAGDVTDFEEKRRALNAVVEHVVPGRLASVRPPSDHEIRGTRVLSLPIDEASAKIRSGPPVDDEEDYAIPCWAGEIPLRFTAGTPISDPKLAPGIAVPESVSGYRR
jgi:nitroimidazol reductase NimA-like FMN-containing flavoprotein (pyridoxamine 5'-phosphate oxidase superfamily)